MASPLQALRKYQKTMMVVFCSLLMIVFIFQAVMTSSFGPSMRDDETGTRVSVSWDGKTYSNAELARFRRTHDAAQQFLYQLASDAIEKGATLRIDPTLMQAGSADSDSYLEEASILLLADEARRNGIIVGDAAVDSFLAELSEGMNEADHTALADRMYGGTFSIQQIRAQLKIELAAIRMYDYLLSGIGGSNVGRQGVLPVRQPRAAYVTPVAALAAERRTNDTARIQFLPIDVEPFLGQIKDSPSSSEIRRLYAAGAALFEDPAKESPGFRMPDRARIQWFKITPEMTNPPVDSITEEQVLAEYNRRVAARELSVAAPVPSIPPSETPLIPPQETPLIPPTNEPGTTEPGEGGSEENTVPGTTEPTPGETQPETPAETPVEAPAETPTETPAPTPEATPEAGSGDGSSESPPATEPTGDGQTSLLGNTQFVSATQDEPAATEPAATEPATAEPQGTEPEATEPAASEASATEPAASETQETPEPTPAEAETQAPAPVEPSATTTQDIQVPGTQVPETPGSGTEEFRVRPLDDELKAKIREDLSRQLGLERREEIIAVLTDRLADQLSKVASYDAEMQAEVIPADTPPPAAPDFKAWVDEFGIEFGDSESLMNQQQMSELPIGQQFSTDFSQFQNFNDIPTVAQILFLDGIERRTLYEPQQVLGNNYIYWISEKSPTHIPSLEECEPQIVRYWKWTKALELAKAEAQKKLDAISSNQTLKDVYPEAQASSSFSYWSVGGGNVGMFQGQRPTISPVPIEGATAEGTDAPATPERLTDIGHEFMRAVFSTQEGGVVVAPNFRRDKIYAIQVVERDEMGPLSETAVMNSPTPSNMANVVIGSDVQQFVREWFTELMKERNVRWTVSN